MTAGEAWRPVEGWPYEVSDLGRIRRSRDGHASPAGRIIAPHVSAGGYFRVHLHDAPRTCHPLVHHLVAQAFLPPPPGAIGRGSDDYQINHRNGRKSDNHPGNIEWVTHRQNHVHASLHHLKTHGAAHHNAKLTPEAVLVIRQMLGRGIRHIDIARAFGVARSTVSSISRGRLWRHV